MSQERVGASRAMQTDGGLRAISETIGITQNIYPSPLHTERMKTQSYFFEVVEGNQSGRKFPLTKDVLHVGRDEWCDIVLENDENVSRHHCNLLLDAHGVRMRDVSRNGTFLEGQRVFDALISVGARLSLGQTVFVLRVEEDTQKEIEVSYFDDSETLVGRSPAMREIFSLMRRLGARETSVCLLGETGVGKSTVARALHSQGKRAKGPFVEINCGALSPSLIESELFGYEKGAFTGADRRKAGIFEQAHGGTLFLDEIGELSEEMQRKLLGVLETKKVRLVGGQQDIPVDFCLISATLKELRKEVEQKKFREDLYFRLAVVEVQVPALRERSEDIPYLANMLLSKIDGPSGLSLSKQAIEKLQRYSWPGNVRELRNVLERAWVLYGKDVITDEMLYLPSLKDDEPSITPRDTLGNRVSTPGGTLEFHDLIHGLSAYLQREGLSLRQLTELIEREMIVYALDANDGKVLQAARELNISKSWAYDRVSKYGLKASKE